MRRKLVTCLLLLGLILSRGGVCALAQTGGGGQSGLDEATWLAVQTRLNQFLEGMGRIYDSSKARLPVSNDVQVSDGYLRMIDNRLRSLELNLRSLNVRWDNYYPTVQWEISQDEDLMDSVEHFEMMRQEAADSLEVRRQMLQALRDFSEAKTFMESLDSTYNRLGKRAFELSLTPRTAPLLEKQKMKEQLVFASVEEKFEKAREAERLHVVSARHMDELEDTYAVLKNKSETIQAMTYKPLVTRIKDYLLGLAAVAVLLMFVNMVNAKIKAAREMRKNMKQYKDALKLNGKDDYPTI